MIALGTGVLDAISMSISIHSKVAQVMSRGRLTTACEYRVEAALSTASKEATSAAPMYPVGVRTAWAPALHVSRRKLSSARRSSGPLGTRKGSCGVALQVRYVAGSKMIGHS